MGETTIRNTQQSYLQYKDCSCTTLIFSILYSVVDVEQLDQVLHQMVLPVLMGRGGGRGGRGEEGWYGRGGGGSPG